MYRKVERKCGVEIHIVVVFVCLFGLFVICLVGINEKTMITKVNQLDYSLPMKILHSFHEL